MVKRGFAQRRKQLQNNLKVEKERWEEICGKLELKFGARAEELSLAEWIRLSNELEPHPCSQLPPSSTESLDVVDENDNVIEQLPRPEIHERKLLHRAVHVFVLNKRGELYLQKRSMLKDSHPGKWDSSASGHVDPGESYFDCAVREIAVEPKGELKCVARLEASDATDQEFIEVYEGQASGKIKVHGKEVDSGRYFSRDQIRSWIEKRPEDFATGFRTCFAAWCSSEDS